MHIKPGEQLANGATVLEYHHLRDAGPNGEEACGIVVCVWDPWRASRFVVWRVHFDSTRNEWAISRGQYRNTLRGALVAFDDRLKKVAA